METISTMFQKINLYFNPFNFKKEKLKRLIIGIYTQNSWTSCFQKFSTLSKTV